MNQTHISFRQMEKDHDVNSLAYDRTIFAFERTALAYLRTAVTFLIASMTLIKFFEANWVKVIGVALLPITFYLLFIGLMKYREINSLITDKA